MGVRAPVTRAASFFASPASDRGRLLAEPVSNVDAPPSGTATIAADTNAAVTASAIRLVFRFISASSARHRGSRTFLDAEIAFAPVGVKLTLSEALRRRAVRSRFLPFVVTLIVTFALPAAR